MTSWLGGRKGRKQKRYINRDPLPKASPRSMRRRLIKKEMQKNRLIARRKRRAELEESNKKLGIRDPNTYNPLVDDPTDPNNPVWMSIKRWDNPGKGPFYIGRVTSTKMRKTAVVNVEYIYRRQKYGKYLRVKTHSTNFMSHDEDEICDAGDIVEIRKSKTWSKRKHWKVMRILKKDPGVDFITKNPEYNIVQIRSDMKLKAEKLRELDMLEHNIQVLPRSKLKELQKEAEEKAAEKGAVDGVTIMNEELEELIESKETS